MKRVATVWGLNGRPTYRMDEDDAVGFARTADGLFMPLPHREAGTYWIDVKMLGDRPDGTSSKMFPVVIYSAPPEQFLFFAASYKNMCDTLKEAHDALAKAGWATDEQGIRAMCGILRDKHLEEPSLSHIPKSALIDCWEIIWMQFYSDLQHGRFKPGANP